MLGGPIPHSVDCTRLLKHREQVDAKSGGNSLSMAYAPLEADSQQQQQQQLMYYNILVARP